MLPTEVAELLRTMHAAWPGAPLDEETPALWCDRLAGVDRVDAEAACYRLIDTERRFPTIAEFLAACRVEARASREAESPRALPLAELDDDEQVVRSSFVAACRAALEVAQRGGSAEEVEATFDRHRPPVAGRRVTYPCRCGEGRGWVMEESGAVRPCDVCRPAMYELWVGGHLVSGHRCAECRPRVAS